MTARRKLRHERKRKAEQTRCIAAEPADPRRAEQLRAMVTTPERYHDERSGGGDDTASGSSTLTTERLLTAERLTHAELLFEAAESAETGSDTPQTAGPPADPGATIEPVAFQRCTAVEQPGPVRPELSDSDLSSLAPSDPDLTYPDPSTLYDDSMDD